jgi:hypothetical protein
MNDLQYVWCPVCKHSELVLGIRPGRLVGSVETQGHSLPVDEPCNVVRLQCGHSIAQKRTQEAG